MIVGFMLFLSAELRMPPLVEQCYIGNKIREPGVFAKELCIAFDGEITSEFRKLPYLERAESCIHGGLQNILRFPNIGSQPQCPITREPNSKHSSRLLQRNRREGLL